MSSRFTKKSLVSASGRLVKTPCCAPSEVGLQDAHAADEHGHFRRGQRQQLRLVHQQHFGRQGVFALEVIAEAVRDGFEHGEGFHVGLLLRGVHASRRERHRDLVTGVFRGLLDAGAAGQNDQIGQRNFLASFGRFVERALDAAECLQHFRQLFRLVDFPIFLRREANARAVRAAALVGAAERGRRRPGGGNQLRDGQAGRENFCFQRRRFPLRRSICDSPREWDPAR